jgi:hypothetical protein
MAELKLYVPTYYGDTEGAAAMGRKEFDDPQVPVVVREADGVRVVLGSHDFWKSDAPDIQIERRARGWLIFLHPTGSGDPSGHVIFCDDGRSFFVPENYVASDTPCVEWDWESALAEVDGEKS